MRIQSRSACQALIPPVSGSSSRSQGGGAGWRQPLALLSLAISALLWVNGLLGSLERPSVDNTLSVRQLQLEVMAAPALPPGWSSVLLSSDPSAALAKDLEEQLAGGRGPGEPDQLLQLVLLQQQLGHWSGAQTVLQQLYGQVPPSQRPLLQLLEQPADASLVAWAEAGPILEAWHATASPLTEQLLCERLRGDGDGCFNPDQQREAVLRLLGVSWLPLLLLLLGMALLLREGWMLCRSRCPLPPLEGPRLSLVDVTLLIAGGFVVLGELSVPLLLAPASRLVLAPLSTSPFRQQSLQVVILYLGLMLPPLTILRAQLLSSPGVAPAGGWLQWRWRPWSAGLGHALSQLLMVLPLVALASWLVERVAGDPGGSNPLLELVLTANDPLALMGFALTATVLAPLFEETLFRGVLLPVLGQRWGVAPALVVSALAFGLAHVSLGELVPLVVLGLGLGWLRLRSGRLGPCVVMHSLWNALTFTNLLLLAG